MSGFAAGASASIKRTMNELDDILRGTELPAGPLRRELRSRLRRLVENKARGWYEIGIARGHTESFREYRSLGKVPTRLTVNRRVRFMTSTRKRRVKVTSTPKL